MCVCVCVCILSRNTATPSMGPLRLLTLLAGLFHHLSHQWWRHQMEAFSALLALCAGNSPVTGEFPAQRPVTRGFDVFFDLRLNKRLSKQWWGWCFEAPWRPLWRHCNAVSSWFRVDRSYVCWGGWLYINVPSCQYRNFHYGDNTILGSSYLHNGNSYTGKTAHLYRIWAQIHDTDISMAYTVMHITSNIHTVLFSGFVFNVLWLHHQSPAHSSDPFNPVLEDAMIEEDRVKNV